MARDVGQVKKSKNGFSEKSGQKGHPPKLYVKRCFQCLKIRQKRLQPANGSTIALNSHWANQLVS